jgi:hypothetical protein
MDDRFYVEPNTRAATPPVTVQEDGPDEAPPGVADHSSSLKFAERFGFVLAGFAVLAFFWNSSNDPGISPILYAPGLLVGIFSGIACKSDDPRSTAYIPAIALSGIAMLFTLYVAWADALVMTF